MAKKPDTDVDQTEAPAEAAAPPPWVNSPEFIAAVAFAAKSVIEQHESDRLTLANEPRPALVGESDGFAQSLAVAIAQLTDQGIGRPAARVSPAVLAARQKAHERCGRLVLAAQEEGLRPEYRLTGKGYMNERFIEPYRRDPATKAMVPTIIIWTGFPSEAMEPVNEIAQRIYEEYRASLGDPINLANQGVPNKQPWITSGGLVVVGDGPTSPRVKAPGAFRHELDVVGAPNDPNAKYVHVLGTVAAPAMQTGTIDAPLARR